MEHFAEFIMNHWLLWSALVVVLGLIFAHERLEQGKRADELTPQAAVASINHDNTIVMDLRDSESYRKGHIIDAIRAKEDDFTSQRMDKYKDESILLVCPRGLQSQQLAAKLKAQGFKKPMVLAGGIAAWQSADLPLVKGK